MKLPCGTPCDCSAFCEGCRKAAIIMIHQMIAQPFCENYHEAALIVPRHLVALFFFEGYHADAFCHIIVTTLPV